MSTLWSASVTLDELVARLTVGRDPELDLELVPYDALASAAHAHMLASIGVLDPDELHGLVGELAEIARDARQADSSFTIDRAEEDGHTAIENRLTAKLGDAGKKIHTGRSRNDQVIAALRLWGREAVLRLSGELLVCADTLSRLARDHAETSMPGTTHTRQAMPSTLGHFFQAASECLLDDLAWLRTAFAHLNRSPLGSASGFGIALPLDRGQVAERLGFDGVQANTLAVQSDRGRSEALVLGVAAAALTDLGRLANDLIRFSTEELAFVALDPATTTGSSIMPQKRNPDVLEIVRASAARCRALQAETAAIYGGLGFGYHRDLQLTKEPFLRGLALAADCSAAMSRVLEALTVDVERCRQAVMPSTAATDAVYSRVAEGTPFRDAYREAAADPAGAYSGPPSESWRQRTHAGAPGDFDSSEAESRLAAEREWLATRRDAIAKVWADLENAAATR